MEFQLCKNNSAHTGNNFSLVKIFFAYYYIRQILFVKQNKYSSFLDRKNYRSLTLIDIDSVHTIQVQLWWDLQRPDCPIPTLNFPLTVILPHDRERHEPERLRLATHLFSFSSPSPFLLLSIVIRNPN